MELDDFDIGTKKIPTNAGCTIINNCEREEKDVHMVILLHPSAPIAPGFAVAVSSGDATALLPVFDH
eukprot:CAMPEP_0194778192 /NCGR_PEP_ID=MMETSP0323_2-20130528/67558_1 /TAXON_ID=2866 ORGANISM="Crypthecodinium cohnii, Strain Seligo" /NCGR_SAMPLE_ID=MMETSP0323_2 /ASSEMBLY_ACC=CAM_ASM_000346 /LENGTH=66 /DNA_ID=CAMNT_0039715269 /DNA_START=83 /DNA_END=283 /DNA_ORIENTATION=-